MIALAWKGAGERQPRGTVSPSRITSDRARSPATRLILRKSVTIQPEPSRHLWQRPVVKLRGRLDCRA
jgi:hypothetical protein